MEYMVVTTAVVIRVRMTYRERFVKRLARHSVPTQEPLCCPCSRHYKVGSGVGEVVRSEARCQNGEHGLFRELVGLHVAPARPADGSEVGQESWQLVTGRTVLESNRDVFGKTPPDRERSSVAKDGRQCC